MKNRSAKLAAVLLLCVIFLAAQAQAIEFLVFAADDRTHADLTISARDCYKRGDIVDAKSDGWPWGGDERIHPDDGGRFTIIKLPGITLAAAKRYAEDNLSADGIRISRRRYWINVPALPAAIRNTLNTTGTYSTTWTLMKPYVIDKTTGVAVP